MREKFVIPFVVLIVAAATFPANGQVIANVDRRNPNDVSWMAFVRVAPEPLWDGAAAYADRTHTYQDVPAALLGAEYVLMSNEDKYNPDHELHVTIASEGTLYLFIDNRVGTHVKDEAISPDLWAAGMAWVAEMGFVDTGMKMTVDESADGTIDNYYTVFSIPVSPGVIVLKAQNDMYTGGPHDRNMYGVAAVAPRKATNPAPADAARVNVVPVLQWTPGLGAVYHNVYLGTAPQLGPVELVAAYIQDPLCRLVDDLAAGITYYWRVDEIQTDMVTVDTGDVWSFTAMAASRACDPNLVGWWKLDGADSGAALDSSGWNHHGALCGRPRWVEGYIGGALQFDGQDDAVETDYAEDLTQWTVCAWVTSPMAPAETAAESGPVDRQANYQLNWNHPDAGFRGAAAMRIEDTWYPARFGQLSADTWHHLAATFDGTALQAYRNGELITANSMAQGVPAPEPTTLKFGRHAAAEVFFAGTVDDVRVYNRALTQEEIETIAMGQRLQAWDPQPGPGANAIAGPTFAVSWSAGDTAVAHDLYVGTVANAVEVADEISPLYQGRLVGTTFPLHWLVESGGRYFWRVDEVEADGETIHKGDVWTFTVSDHLVVDDFESYTDSEGSRIEETWIDGTFNNTGSQVGRSINPSTGSRDRTHGEWSMFLAYDNTRPPFVSEVEREFASEEDWPAGEVNTLSLWFRGDLVSFRETAPGAFAMSATGADIWGAGDEFRYAYKRLDGDGSIVARVERVGNTDLWAKAGVMIRESLDPASAYAFMLVTPDGLRAFQNRPANYSATCLSAHSWETMGMPYWVKLERRGDQFTGYHSVDGINWIQQPDTDNTRPDPSPNPQTIRMPPYVYIGLALTSHARGVVTTATFSDVEITGDVIGQWQVADIGVAQPGNSPCELYVVVEDSAGETAMVIHPDPTVVSATTWTEWEIPLSSFAGVNLQQVRRMCIGAGTPDAVIPAGSGRIYIDDIRLFNR